MSSLPLVILLADTAIVAAMVGMSLWSDTSRITDLAGCTCGHCGAAYGETAARAAAKAFQKSLWSCFLWGVRTVCAPDCWQVVCPECRRHAQYDPTETHDSAYHRRLRVKA